MDTITASSLRELILLQLVISRSQKTGRRALCLTVSPWLTSNLQFSCSSLLSAGMTGMCRHTILEPAFQLPYFSSISQCHPDSTVCMHIPASCSMLLSLRIFSCVTPLVTWHSITGAAAFLQNSEKTPKVPSHCVVTIKQYSVRKMKENLGDGRGRG